MKIIVDHPFNTYVTLLYKDEAAKAALHHLKISYTLNVNLILYSIWYSQNQRGRFHKQDIKALLQSIHPWHDRVLIALQRLQHLLVTHAKLNVPVIRDAIAKEIMSAEKIERLLIADTLLKLNHSRRNPAQQLSDACYNITHYCLALPICIDDENKKAITTLLQASFSNLIAEEINEVCTHALNPSTSTYPISFSQLTLEEI